MRAGPEAIAGLWDEWSDRELRHYQVCPDRSPQSQIGSSPSRSNEREGAGLTKMGVTIIGVFCKNAVQSSRLLDQPRTPVLHARIIVGWHNSE